MTEIVWRDLLDDEQRMSVPARLFGVHFLRVENFIFTVAQTLSSTYRGGYWHFYALSNSAFSMAPAGEHRIDVRCENGYAGTLSPDAFGITCCLYAYSNLSFAGPEALAGACARQYHLLRDYMLSEHGEARAILAATD